MLTKLKAAAENAFSHDGEIQNCSRRSFVSWPSGVPFSESRRNPRCSFIAAVSVLEPSSGAHIKAHTTDLSPSGCYIDTMNSFAPGTKVQLRITKEGKSVEADAVVAYSQVGVGMGLTLTTIAPGHRPVLDRWFAELRGDVSPAPSTLDAVKDVQASSTLKTKSDYALEELLVILMRKGLMTEEEGEPILRACSAESRDYLEVFRFGILKSPFIWRIEDMIPSSLRFSDVAEMLSHPIPFAH
jgi:PilZ domain